MKTDPIKVLYISGSAHCGSTLLGYLLGELKGFINVGEAIGYLFNENLLSRNIPCGCGEEVSNCSFWKDIVLGIPRDTQAFATKFARIRYFPFLTFPSHSPAFTEPLSEFSSQVTKIYSKILEHTGNKIIIDSSKNPSLAYLLSENLNIELYVIHLVRDPRGVVHSWIKPKEYLRSSSPQRTIFLWLAYNHFSELLKKYAKNYLLIRYEDFIREPEKNLTNIAGLVEQNTGGVNVPIGKPITLGVHHALAGNPMKFHGGEIILKEKKWSLPSYIHIPVSLFTYPLLSKYKYI